MHHPAPRVIGARERARAVETASPRLYVTGATQNNTACRARAHVRTHARKHARTRADVSRLLARHANEIARGKLDEAEDAGDAEDAEDLDDADDPRRADGPAVVARVQASLVCVCVCVCVCVRACVVCACAHACVCVPIQVFKCVRACARALVRECARVSTRTPRAHACFSVPPSAASLASRLLPPSRAAARYCTPRALKGPSYKGQTWILWGQKGPKGPRPFAPVVRRGTSRASARARTSARATRSSCSRCVACR